MYEYKVLQVVKVIDGDTVDVKIDLGFGITSRIRVRLASVDTPEVYGRNAEELGVVASDFTKSWLACRQGCLSVKTYKGSMSSTGIGDGAFGRWLGTFTDTETGETLAEALIHSGFAE